MKLLIALFLLFYPGEHVEYFPSILYGHILTGPGMSRYETIFTITAKKEIRCTLALFEERGEPMKASFVDAEGKSANTGSSFEFFLMPDRPVKIKLALPPEESSADVVVRTGWATFSGPEEIDISALVLIRTPDGKVITRHVLGSEKPPTGD